MTLAQAVKLVGSAGELEKMWRNHAGDSGRTPMHRAGERNKDTGTLGGQSRLPSLSKPHSRSKSTLRLCVQPSQRATPPRWIQKQSDSTCRCCNLRVKEKPHPLFVLSGTGMFARIGFGSSRQ